MINWRLKQDGPDPAMTELNAALEELYGRISRPGINPTRGIRRNDIDLEQAPEGPGIMPLRPRRDLPESLPVPTDRDARLSYDEQTEAMPDPEEIAALEGLRSARGNLSGMLDRYGVGGYGNIDRNASGRATGATIHGDPVNAEATRVRALREDARRSADLNRMMAQSRAQMIADSRRMDPLDAAKYEREAVIAADEASPTGPEASKLPTNVEELAGIRDLLTRGRVGNVLDREKALTGARTYMDPTIQEARAMQRAERPGELAPEIEGDIRRELAGNPEAAYVPELRDFLFGPGGPRETPPEPAAGPGADTNTMTREELLEFAAETGRTPRAALEYITRFGMSVR